MIGLDAAGFDRLMPLHLIVALDGTILKAGPTVRKLCRGEGVVGSPFLSHFDFRTPRDVTAIADVIGRTDAPLRLSLRDKARTVLKAQAVELECGRAVLIDLSFGIAVVDAARRYSLTSSDFGGTDLGIEMLFLTEAQRAALTEARRFSLRLDAARASAEKEASTDRLTGLSNLRAIEHSLDEMLAQGTPFCFLQADIDGFRGINEQFGRPGGDAVLREVAHAFRRCFRRADLVARISSDVFVAIVPTQEDSPGPADLARRTLRAISLTLADGDPPWHLSVSLGAVPAAPGLYGAADEILQAAEAALVSAKQAGGGQYSLVSSEA